MIRLRLEKHGLIDYDNMILTNEDEQMKILQREILTNIRLEKRWRGALKRLKKQGFDINNVVLKKKFNYACI